MLNRALHVSLRGMVFIAPEINAFQVSIKVCITHYRIQYATVKPKRVYSDRKSICIDERFRLSGASFRKQLDRCRDGEVAGSDRASLLLFFLSGDLPHISHSNLMEPSLTRAIAGSDVRSSGISLRLVSGNEGAERIFGYSINEMIGTSILRLIPPERRREEEEIPARISRIRRGGHYDHFETIRLTKDGPQLRISPTVSPIKDANGNVVGVSQPSVPRCNSNAGSD